MSREIIPRGSAALPEVVMPRVEGIDLYGALLADSLCDNTLQSRVYDVKYLGRYLGIIDPSLALALVFSGTAGQANALALAYRRHMLDGGLSPGTINRRLATLRRASRLARRLGLVAWTLDVDCLKQERYRDTAGPGHEGWRKILAVAEGLAAGGSSKGLRDLAMIRLLHDSGLRKGEMMALDVGHLDLPGLRVAVVGKGKKDAAWITINRPTADALSGWLAVRGTTPGALFVRLDKSARRGAMASGARRMARLSDRAANRIVVDLGQVAGVERGCRPHGLRHAGATRLLDLTNGDVRAVQKWTRHVQVNTVIIYDDNRVDLAGKLARMLGDDD